MTDKRPGKRGEHLPQPKQYDTTTPEWQIAQDLEGVIRLGVLQAELLKSVQGQLRALLLKTPPRPS